MTISSRLPLGGEFRNIIQKRNIFWNKTPKSELKYHLISDNSSKKPTILMIGWAGAASKHMEKYTKIYNDKGFNVVSICPPLFHFKVPNDSIGKTITPLMENIPKTSSIVIHSFSMNGIRGLISLSKATGNPKMMDNIDGIIFDSAPSLTFPYQNGRAMMLSRPSVSYLSDETRSKMYELCNSIRDSLLTPFLKMVPSLRNYFIYWNILDNIQLPKRQLYFYSHRDSMVPFGPLEEFIEIQKSRGCHVEAINFGETKHVAHFRSNPEEYSKKCIEFVSKF